MNNEKSDYSKGGTDGLLSQLNRDGLNYSK